MRILYYMKRIFPEVTSGYYSPENYLSYDPFTLEPLESALVLLDVNEAINRLNICCGRLTSWSQRIQLCIMVVNISLEESIQMERRSTLTEPLNKHQIINYMSCIPSTDLVRLLQQNI